MSAERDDLLRAIGEAAALSADHELRKAVEARVAEAGAFAERAWLGTLRQDETLRLDLQRVPVPEDLEESLLHLPSQRTGSWRRVAWRIRPAWAAAAVILALGALVAVAWIRPELQRDRRLKTVALLAIHDHLNDRSVKIATSDPAILDEALTAALGFPVQLLPPAGGFSLVGGRRCTLGPHPIAYSLWRGPKGEYSFIEGRASDFGLPARFGPQRVHPSGPAAAGLRSAALVWSREGRLYILVADRAYDLPAVKP